MSEWNLFFKFADFICKYLYHQYEGKKEHIWVSSNEVDEPRAYYTEWSESKRKTNIPY